MISIRNPTVIALAIAVTIVSPAIAQDAPQQVMAPWTSGRGMMGYGAMGSSMMGASGSAEAMCTAMGSHIDGRLAYAKAELKVTEAQESLWNAFATASHDNAKTMVARCATMMGNRDSRVSLPDRLDQNEQLMAAQLDAVRAMDKVLKPLYEGLSDGQKKTADQLFWGPMGMM